MTRAQPERLAGHLQPVPAPPDRTPGQPTEEQVWSWDHSQLAELEQDLHAQALAHIRPTFDDLPETRVGDHSDDRRRLLADDAHVIEQIAADDFTGHLYDALIIGLVEYGDAVISAWLYDSSIYARCASRGRGVTCENYHRELLFRERDERRQVALETVAEALHLFEQDALRGGRWNPDHGASLATYFVGACLLAFPNVFRRWRKEQPVPPQPALAAIGEDTLALLVDPLADPARSVMARMHLKQVLRSLKPADQELVRMLLGDASQQEMAAKLDITVEAVQMRLNRLRHRLRLNEQEE
ncbi:hypothetical protein [Herbidospora mongoliensis]|uniref:hypothetical protein n=1 Tax=Herbidospora mongoliensis TaxID=688067 RepID=UPI00082D67B3|nr:hypothetical protein [Herbidospora mongoliensis]